MTTFLTDRERIEQVRNSARALKRQIKELRQLGIISFGGDAPEIVIESAIRGIDQTALRMNDLFRYLPRETDPLFEDLPMREEVPLS